MSVIISIAYTMQMPVVGCFEPADENLHVLLPVSIIIIIIAGNLLISLRHSYIPRVEMSRNCNLRQFLKFCFHNVWQLHI